jgi:outer membrane murein-binding lipoprotein Lpp
MNKNKGVIGIGLIIAIVLGVAVVGGGAYYLGKGSNQEVNEIPEISEINSKVDDIKNIDIKPVEQTKPFSDNNQKIIGKRKMTSVVTIAEHIEAMAASFDLNIDPNMNLNI